MPTIYLNIRHRNPADDEGFEDTGAKLKLLTMDRLQLNHEVHQMMSEGVLLARGGTVLRGLTGEDVAYLAIPAHSIHSIKVMGTGD